MVDWKGFQNQAAKLTQQYTDKDVKICLITLDPSILVNFTFLARLLTRTGITQFRFGRDFCFGKLFLMLLKKNPNLFQQASVDAVNSFNSLVSTLFSEKLARKLFVSSQAEADRRALLRENLPYEKRLELFLRQAVAFQDLLTDAGALPRSNHQEGITDHQRTLVELEKRLDDRLGQLDALKSKKELFFSSISKLPTATPQLFGKAKLDEWNQIFSALSPYYKVESKEALSFVDGEKFAAWMAEEMRSLSTADSLAQILQNYKVLEKEIQQFLDQLHDVSSYLYQKHVQGYVEVVEIELLQKEPAEHIREGIKKQIAHVLHLNHVIKENFDSLKKRSVPYLQKLFVAEFIPFKDLPKEADRILTDPFHSVKAHLPAITDEMEKEYEGEIKGHTEAQLKKIENLLSVAKSRAAKMDEMEEFQHAFLQVINQVRFYKDLHEEFLQYESQAQKLALSRQDLTKATFSEIERILQERIQLYEEFRAKTPEITRQLASASQKSEQCSIDDKLAIKRRLFEIFWNISPYQDLAENVAALRESLTQELKNTITKFYHGELTSSEFLFACQEMPYEHDVVKLRNEITHRSGRLKDLRDEAIRIYREVTNFRRYLEIAGMQKERVYRDFVSHQAKIREILLAIENPFIAFSKATNKDEINYVFRNQWIRIEELQPLVEKSKEEAFAFLKRGAVTLKGAFLRTLVSLEELFQLKDAERLPIVTQSERELNLATPDGLYEAIVAQVHAIEKRFHFCQPFSYYMLISDHSLRLKLFQEAFHLDEQLDGVYTFAKSMQYVKTFEEERVDIILEAFERRYLLEDEKSDSQSLSEAWSRYQKRMQRVLNMVVDEIFLDIGLLDRHALMDVDPQALNKTLQLAIDRAKMHLAEPGSVFDELKFLPSTDSSHLMCQKSLDDLKKNIDAWSKMPMPDSSDTDVLLERLRNFCHLLFDAKVVMAASQGMLLPKCLKLMNDLRSLSSYLEEWLQQKRGDRKAVWGIPWIPECYSIRTEIETFEANEETGNAFRPLVKRVLEMIQQIPEIAYLKTQDPDPIKILTISREFSQHLEEIDTLAKEPKREHPFIYIPGYMAYFGSE